MAGAPPSIPPLLDLQGKRSAEQIGAIVQHGSGRMPSFPTLTPVDITALARYILSGESKELQSSGTGAARFPKYRFTGYHKFLDPDGYPAVAPPWGTLNAINLNTGEYAWKIPLGEYPELVANDTENDRDRKLRRPDRKQPAAWSSSRRRTTTVNSAPFDNLTGKLLWETILPFAGNATPVTYEVDGRQYVVIYATGGKSGRGKPSGGIYVAFALPESGR